jgi:peptidoglycan/LPS O-acetylase OafA/YrhL
MSAGRDNSFGAFRLLFASLVIVSHSIEMLDGDATREPMHRLFGGMTLGALAVDGFFLISGFLIAASFHSDRVGYFRKRILRIYPAYLACVALCIFLVAPLAGGDLRALDSGQWLRLAYRTLLLKAPEMPGVFHGMTFQGGLDGSMWSISYEFRCYIAAAVFGLLGLYRRPRIFAGLTLAVLGATVVANLPQMQTAARYPAGLVGALGDPPVALRLLGAFMTGTCFWLLRPHYRGWLAAAAAVAAVALQFVGAVAEPALIVFGGYALFWAVFAWNSKFLRTLNAKDDISYGVYLYAWPIGGLIIWYWRAVPVPVLILATLAGSLICGALSWFLLEKQALRLKTTAPWRRKSPARAGPIADPPRPAPEKGS